MAKRHVGASEGHTLETSQDAVQTAGEEFRSRQEELTAPVALRAVTLGFVGGLRSTAPFTLLDWTRKQNPPPTNTLEEFLDSSSARVLLNLLSAGELVGDKLPGIPSRISPAPLLGRLGLGALAGLSVFRRYNQPLFLGAVLGALGAGAGALGGYYARAAVAEATKAPQWLLGIVEDGLAIGLGIMAVRRP